MQVNSVSKEDAIAVVQLFNALKVGKFEVNGTDLQALAMSLRWLQNLSVQMQASLKGEGVSKKEPSSPMRVKPDPVSPIKGPRKGK